MPRSQQDAGEQPTLSAELHVVKLSLSPDDKDHPGINEWSALSGDVAPRDVPLPEGTSGHHDEDGAGEQWAPPAGYAVVYVILPAPGCPGIGEQEQPTSF